MKKNQGFIATSLLYSFFLVFCALLLALVGSFMHNRVLLDHTVDNIKKELSNALDKKISLTEIGNYVKMPLFSSIADVNLEDIKWIVASKNTVNKTITLISDNAVVMTNNYRNIAAFNEEVNSYFNLYTTGSTNSSYVRSVTNQDITSFQNVTDITIRKALLSEGNSYLYHNTTNNNFYLYQYTCTTSDTCSVITNQKLQSTNTTLYGLRLIVTLADTTPIVSGNGTSNDPYNILYYVYKRNNEMFLELHYDYLNPSKNLGFQTSINTIADLSSNNHNGTMLASYTNNLTNGLTLPTENCLNTGLSLYPVLTNSAGYTLELVVKNYISLVARTTYQRNYINIYSNGGSVSLPSYSSNVSGITPNVFHTYSFIKRNGANVMIYVDGTLQLTTSINNIPSVINDILHVGAYYHNSTTTYAGIMKSLRVYNMALTDTEILHNYNVDQRWQIS